MPRFAAASGALAAALLFGFAGQASAAPAVTVSPAQNLADGATVTVSGSGLQAGPGAILQCNTATGQPTIAVAGNQVPVGCTNPLSKLINADASGNVPATPFTVKMGTIGPPATGPDSAGKDATADAANYPCPPTAAQQAAGAMCVVALGDAAGHQATQQITFQAATTTTVAATQTTQAPVATTTTVASGTLSRTGPGSLMGTLAIGSIIILDAGYLLYSSTRRRRRLSAR